MEKTKSKNKILLEEKTRLQFLAQLKD